MAKPTPRLTPRGMGMWMGLSGKMNVLKGAMDSQKMYKGSVNVQKVKKPKKAESY